MKLQTHHFAEWLCLCIGNSLRKGLRKSQESPKSYILITQLFVPFLMTQSFFFQLQIISFLTSKFSFNIPKNLFSVTILKYAYIVSGHPNIQESKGLLLFSLGNGAQVKSAQSVQQFSKFLRLSISHLQMSICITITGNLFLHYSRRIHIAFLKPIQRFISLFCIFITYLLPFI